MPKRIYKPKDKASVSKPSEIVTDKKSPAPKPKKTKVVDKKRKIKKDK